MGPNKVKEVRPAECTFSCIKTKMMKNKDVEIIREVASNDRALGDIKH